MTGLPRKTLCTLIGLWLVLTASAAPARAQSDTGQREQTEPIQVLIVGGGSSHDFYRWFYEADAATLEAAGAEVRYTDVPEHILPGLRAFDVLYLSNNQPLPGEELREAIFYFVNSGKGLMIGHAAAWYNWADWPAFNRDLVGGGARGHRAYGTFEVTVTDPDHPVMKGVPSTFTIKDELYRFEKHPEGPPIRVLATAENPETGKVYPVVWTVHHTNGRVVVNTLGHDGAAHNHPAYRQILKNSLRWTARRGQR